jgi:hypothetical protein
LVLGAGVDVPPPFSDPGVNDTHTCTVVWDDGATEPFAAAGGACDRRHVFDRAGMFTLKVTVRDDDGQTDTGSVMVVVYDPTAGVASGNGWLDAARTIAFVFLGGYPSATATVPQGALTFTAEREGLHLRAHRDLEWLVITPDDRIALKGRGELSTGRAVQFVLYARPGQPHELRMVIWEASRGLVPDGVPAIHDTSPGAPFDLDEARLRPVAAGTVHLAR